jgi:hypothetical protein
VLSLVIVKLAPMSKSGVRETPGILKHKHDPKNNLYNEADYILDSGKIRNMECQS